MKRKNVGNELIKSLTQARDLLREGNTAQLSIREVRQVPPPHAYTPAAIHGLRRKLNVSQAVFAAMIGVSTVLVQSWEQGKREPSRLACRLLDVINQDPAKWKQFVRVA